MNKALIVAPSWIGDTIMAQPLFARLCARHPGLQLDALAPRWVAPVLQRMAEIHEVIDSPFGHGQLSIKARWRLGRDLAARGYDAVYVLPNSLKSALVPWLAGIPQRVGFTGESRYGLINVRHDLDKQALPLMVERFVQLAETPGTPPALAEALASAQVPAVPGAATPTEFIVLMALGFRVCKLFPSNAGGGLAMVKGLAGPFPDLKLCANGGINEASAGDYLAEANVVCVGGSWMLPKAWLAAGDWDKVRDSAAKAVQIAAGARGAG